MKPLLVIAATKEALIGIVLWGIYASYNPGTFI